MNRVLKALLISACATAAASFVMTRYGLIDSPNDDTGKTDSSRKEIEEFEDLTAEQTESLVAELAAQV